MRVHVIFFVLAISGASGWAAASVTLQAAPELVAMPAALVAPSEPVLVLAPASVMGASEEVLAAPERVLSSVASTFMVQTERVDRLPMHQLLPDGALIASYDPVDAGVLSRGMLVRDASVATPASAPSAPPSESLPLTRRTESSGLTDVAVPARASSPEPVVSQQATVFDPRPTNVASHRGAYVGGGFALAAIAGLGVLLYHRIRPNAALENETRKVIFESVCNTPGLGVHEISRNARVSYSTATYHLERLVGAGMLVMTPDGNKLCYYKNGGAFSESERKILPLLKNEEAAKLFEAILDAPGTYRAALAEKLGVTATTINWHLRRLREAGLVDETRAGRSAHLYARMDNLRPTFASLAIKVESSEPIIAQRLRKYADGSNTSAAGAVGAA